MRNPLRRARDVAAIAALAACAFRTDARGVTTPTPAPTPSGSGSSSFDVSFSPPPLSTIHMLPGVIQWNTGAMAAFMELETTDFMTGKKSTSTMTMLGVFSETSHGPMRGKFLRAINASVVNGGGDFGFMSMKMSIMSVNFEGLHEFGQGMKKNAAGEITELKSSLSMFFGFGFGAGFVLIRFKQKIPILGDQISSGMLLLQANGGLIADLVLSRKLQLQPFVYAQGGGAVVPGQDSIALPPFVQAGGDIVLRPFTNDPGLKISLGTGLQLITAASKGVYMFMGGVRYEVGARYSAKHFGVGGT